MNSMVVPMKKRRTQCGRICYDEEQKVDRRLRSARAVGLINRFSDWASLLVRNLESSHAKEDRTLQVRSLLSHLFLRERILP